MRDRRSLATSPTNTGLRRFGHQMRWYTIRCTMCSSLWYSICCIIQLYRQPCKSETLATLARAGLRAREAGEKPVCPPGQKPCGLRRANSLSADENVAQIRQLTPHSQDSFSCCGRRHGRCKCRANWQFALHLQANRSCTGAAVLS